MATFDYRKFLKENKSTFHASLTEGQFSWMTQDTEQQIGSEKENTIDVYMFDNKGKYWHEPSYDGYGEFGGKDYYDLVAEMNGYTTDDAEEFGGTFKELRGIGIKLAFGELEPKNGGPVLFPALIADPAYFNYKTHDFTKEAEQDPNQSWYTSEYEDEDEDDYNMGFVDMDREEDYDEEELDESKLFEVNSKDASDIAEKFAQYMSKKEDKKFTVTPGSVDEKSFDLDLDGEKYMGGSYLIKDNGDIVNAALGNKIAGNINQLEEDKKQYYKDAEKDDAAHIAALEKDMEDDKKSSMTKEELKAKIKEIILAEMDVNIEDENEMYDPLAENETTKMKKSELKARIKEMILAEVDEEEEVEDTEEVDVDVEDPEPTEEPVGDGGLKVTQNADADLTGTQKEVQDNLEAALEAAKKLDDDKLAKQIGNSLTFFTRQHVVKEELSEKLLLKKRAGIITETQYKEYLLILEDENIDESLKSSILAGLIALTSIAGVGKVYKMDAEFEQNKQAQTEYYQNVLTPAAEKLSKADLADLGLSINEKTKKLALYNQTDPQQIETIFSTYAQNYMRSNPDQFAVGVDGGVVWTLNPTAN